MGEIQLLQKVYSPGHYVCHNCKHEKLIEYVAVTESDQFLDICGDCRNEILAENGIEITDEATHLINPPNIAPQGKGDRP